MDDFIRREEAIAYIREQSEECQKAFEELGGESGIYADAYNDLAEDFYSIPAADVAPVVHGLWVEHLDEMECSVCKRQWNYCDNDTNTFNFCPNCGAKMDGGDNDACVGSNDFCSYGERKDGEN